MKMERDFNIQCSAESEYNPLNNRWCLRQFQKDGTKFGRDLVPSSYIHHFEASKIVHTISYEDRHEELPPERLETKEVIYAGLVPETLSSRTYSKPPRYYMLGYRDAVEQISIEIFRSEKDDRCTVTSYERFQSDIDFGDHPDSLYFSVKLSPDKFDAISELIKLDRLDRLSLTVQFADGFYSEYFHGDHDYIDSICVLSRSAINDFNLEDYADHLSVTGKVGSFMVRAHSKVEIELIKTNDREDVASVSSQEHDLEQDRFAAMEDQIGRTSDFLSRAADVLANMDRLLKRIRLPLWLAVLLLALIFVQNL